MTELRLGAARGRAARCSLSTLRAAADETKAARASPLPQSWSAAMSRADVQLGRVDADHDDGYLYRLPYGDDVSFPIIQGYGAKLSHRGAERFTLDFGMPVGTPVHAARDGVVVLVEDSHDAGCAREECGRYANFVVVLHSDGTTGEYFHLERGSVQVRVGERVAARAAARALRQHGLQHGAASALRRLSNRPRAAARSRSPCAFRRAPARSAAPRSGAHYLNRAD